MFAIDTNILVRLAVADDLDQAFRARKLIETGKIPRDEEVVLCITGHGLKTQEAVVGKCGEPRIIKPSLREFEEEIYNKDAAAAS